MSDLQRLVDGFDAGELVRPYAGATGLVDIVRGVAHACGVPDVRLNDASRAVADHLVRAEHIVLLVADGLGIDFIDAMPRAAWLRRHTRRTIQATYPSATPVAITSVATGEYPAQHAITGWWTHLPSLGAPVTVFLHERATDEEPLERLGVGIRDLCPLEPLFGRMQRDVALVMPSAIADSAFTRYMAADAVTLRYTRHAEAAQMIADRVTRSAGPTFTYWYTPVPDTLAHEHGTRDARVMAALEDLDIAVEALDRSFERDERSARILVTADHGHLDVGGAGHLELLPGDPLLRHLRCPPSGDVRTLFWHVQPEAVVPFAREFRARFGEWFLLLTAAEAEGQALLGPEPLAAETRRRIGDFVSIALGSEVMRYGRDEDSRQRFLGQRAHHSGLSAAEMHVPLILGGPGPAPEGEWGGERGGRHL
ncbi:MAG: alkaline phosphatase family protein [Dehalococcoidia bacterium]